MSKEHRVSEKNEEAMPQDNQRAKSKKTHAVASSHEGKGPPSRSCGVDPAANSRQVAVVLVTVNEYVDKEACDDGNPPLVTR